MISVIVPTLRNRPESLQRTLDSIEKNTHTKYEVIIAEGGDCYSASMNNGIRKAKGDYLTIPGIADDIEVEPYCFDNMVEFMRLNNIDYGVFKIINPSGSLESYGGFVMPEAMNTTPDGVPDYAGYGLITRKGFETVGLMDEHFKPIYCEDADYGLRVHEAGLRVGVCAGAVLRHHHEQAGRVFDYHHNKEYLWKKHRL